MKQWQLKPNSKVDLGNMTATFLGMDGAYARWEIDGKVEIGNFEKFKKTDTGYKKIK